MGNNRLITDDKSVAKIFNDCFTFLIQLNLSNNSVQAAVYEIQNHESILKIKPNQTHQDFNFRPVSYEEALTEFKNLDMSTATQWVGIPTKIVMESLNAFATFLVKDLNKCIKNASKNFTKN